MIPLVDKASWAKYLRGYTIYDCAILHESAFAFILVEEKDHRDQLPLTRIMYIEAEQPPASRFGVCEGGSFTFATIAAGVDPLEYIAVDMQSRVFSAGEQQMGEETAMDELIDMRTCHGKVGIINRVVRVADQVYALGDYRRIYRRLGLEQWIEIGTEGKGVGLPGGWESPAADSSFGFSDMCGFSGDDMYAAGGKGDVWRFDGDIWHQCPIPTDADLKTVCCGGDGVVYITERNGSVWAGRDDRWKRIAESTIAFGYQPVDSVWFNNRLYLGGQQGVWVIDFKRRLIVPLHDVEAGAPDATNSGRLDLCPDALTLLTAGPHGTCINDGSGWRSLFSTFDFIR